MNYTQINIDDIKTDDALNVIYKGNKIVFKTPILYLPFGVDKSYQNIFMKMQMRTNYYDDDTYATFTTFIETLEAKLAELTGKEIRSQLAYNNRYGNTLMTKVPHFKDRVSIDVNRDGKYAVFDSIDSKQYLTLELVVDRLWEYNEDTLTYKIKVQTINIIE
jgi:hypothetical protein